MWEVSAALVPGIGIYVWHFGWGVLIQCGVATIAAVMTEAAIVGVQHRPVRACLADGSAIMSGLLIGIALPPLAPWWMAVTGAMFAMAMAKHAYGGLGSNVFNPAMAGYVFAFLCFPAMSNRWPPVVTAGADFPSLSGTARVIFAPHAAGVDATSGATPLALIKTDLRFMSMLSEMRDSGLFGAVGAVGWEWVSAAFLAGGMWLLYRRIIRWHIPAAMLGTMFVVAAIAHTIDPDRNLSPGFHLFSGATMIGAFFIATDPVSAPCSPLGRLIYGAGVGALTTLLRSAGSYPDGIAFAVLIMNALAPLIDHLTRPRVFGQRS
jgi:electron transport complex protein RnfD